MDIVVRKCTPVFQLKLSEKQLLLVEWDSKFALDFRFDNVDGAGCLDVKCYGFSCEENDGKLHAATGA